MLETVLLWVAGLLWVLLWCLPKAGGLWLLEAVLLREAASSHRCEGRRQTCLLWLYEGLLHARWLRLERSTWWVSEWTASHLSDLELLLVSLLSELRVVTSHLHGHTISELLLRVSGHLRLHLLHLLLALHILQALTRWSLEACLHWLHVASVLWLQGSGCAKL